MDATFVAGNPVRVDYTPSGADVAAGDVVVLGNRPCIAHRDIADSDLGSLAAGGGVYDVVKDASAIPAGTVYWTGTAATATKGTNDIIGWAPAAAADTDSTVRIMHEPGPLDAIA